MPESFRYAFGPIGDPNNSSKDKFFLSLIHRDFEYYTGIMNDPVAIRGLHPRMIICYQWYIDHYLG